MDILAKHTPSLQTTLQDGHRLWFLEVSTIPQIFHQPICNRLGLETLLQPPKVSNEEFTQKLNQLRLLVFEVMPSEVETEFMKKKVGTLF